MLDQMNWLAHLYLSEPTAEYRLGNLLPDFARPSEFGPLPPEIMAGVECHGMIDSFTDSHPVFRRSVNRIPAPHRRFGGIIIDVFYDHLLTANWPNFSPVPLQEFVSAFYQALPQFDAILSPEISLRFRQMREADILNSYQTLDGVETALARIARRLQKKFPLELAVAGLRSNYDSLRSDFDSFFPELRERVVQFQETQRRRNGVTLKN